MSKPRTANFVVFRTVESLVFGAPIVVAFMQESIGVFLLTMLVSLLLYGIWSQFLKRRLSGDDANSYDAVYRERDPFRVYRFSDFFPMRILLLWAAALIVSFYVL